MLPEWILFRKKIEGSKHDLQGARLGYAKLMEADLAGADLRGADLSTAYLIRANLSGADLDDADLEDAYLSGADLTDVSNLTCDQIELANFDEDTRFPDYIQITWTSEKNCTCSAMSKD